MKVTPTTKRLLAIERDKRDRLAEGWEHVGERGGNLWELYRGGRIGYVITDVRIAADGISLWVKVADQVG